MDVVHYCVQGTYCIKCVYNVRQGGRPNFPENTVKKQVLSVKSSGTLKAVQECGFRGMELPEKVVCPTCTGKVELKVYECEVFGKCTLGKSYPGMGCCSGCGKVKESNPSPIKWRSVPVPKLVPYSKRLIITVATGDLPEYKICQDSHRQYAKRVGADYIVLNDQTQDVRNFCLEKFRTKDYVPYYPEGTLFLDSSDVFVMPYAPDIFDPKWCAPDKIGMVDILSRMHKAFTSHVIHEVKELCQSQGVPVLPEMNKVYYNSGVWLGRPGHEGYWDPPLKPIPGKHCDEENWCRWNVFYKGLLVHSLDRRFNWTWAEDRTTEFWENDRPWFVHLAGMGSEVPGWKLSNRQWRMNLLRIMRMLTKA